MGLFAKKFLKLFHCYEFNQRYLTGSHCVKGVCIRSFSGPYFLALGMNTERYSVPLHIQSECGKIRTRKTPNTDPFTQWS